MLIDIGNSVVTDVVFILGMFNLAGVKGVIEAKVGGLVLSTQREVLLVHHASWSKVILIDVNLWRVGIHTSWVAWVHGQWCMCISHVVVRKLS